MLEQFTTSTARRGFLGRITAAAFGLGAATLVPAQAHAAISPSPGSDPELEAWFAKLTGKHRAVFDAPEANGGMPAIWPRVYLNTTESSYPGQGVTAMVILRHGGLAMALGDAVWQKYPIGEMFGVNDGDKPAMSNPYARITNLPLPGLGIEELLKSGVLVGACDVALTVYSSGAARKVGADAAAVRKDWVAGLLPGIRIVPSGVMAAARAQELGASYIFAG